MKQVLYKVLQFLKKLCVFFRLHLHAGICIASDEEKDTEVGSNPDLVEDQNGERVYNNEKDQN